MRHQPEEKRSAGWVLGMLLWIILTSACSAAPMQEDTPLPAATAHSAVASVRPSQAVPSSSPFSARETDLPTLTLLASADWPSSSTQLSMLDTLPFKVHLQVVPDPLEALQAGMGSFAVVSDASGIPIGHEPLALAVPFWHALEGVSYAEAERLRYGSDAVILPRPWRALEAALRPLRVDGRLPGDPDYALQLTWSLMADADYEQAATQLAAALGQVLQQDPVVHIAAVGDVMLDRGLGAAIAAGDASYPFGAIKGLLDPADIVVGNLESALGTCQTPQPKGYTFCASPAAVDSLAQAGFDLLSLANNHAMDYGSELMLAARERLQAAGMASVGAGANVNQAHEPWIADLNGLRVGFLAYVNVPVEQGGFDTRLWTATPDLPGVAWAEPVGITSDVSALQSEVDLVVVLLHSGYEYVTMPNEVQRVAAHAAIDAGAALVLGHHAHVLQPLEFYKDGVIAYGLGNFAFQNAGPPQTLVLHAWLDQEGVRHVSIDPVMLQPYDGRPLPASIEQAEAIRADFYRMTQGYNAP